MIASGHSMQKYIKTLRIKYLYKYIYICMNTFICVFVSILICVWYLGMFARCLPGRSVLSWAPVAGIDISYR